MDIWSYSEYFCTTCQAVVSHRALVSGLCISSDLLDPLDRPRVQTMKAKTFLRAFYLIPAATASISIPVSPATTSASTYYQLCHPGLLSTTKRPSPSLSPFCSFLAHQLLTNMLTRFPFALFALTDVSIEVGWNQLSFRCRGHHV